MLEPRLWNIEQRLDALESKTQHFSLTPARVNAYVEADDGDWWAQDDPPRPSSFEPTVRRLWAEEAQTEKEQDRRRQGQEERRSPESRRSPERRRSQTPRRQEYNRETTNKTRHHNTKHKLNTATINVLPCRGWIWC